MRTSPSEDNFSLPPNAAQMSYSNVISGRGGFCLATLQGACSYYHKGNLEAEVEAYEVGEATEGPH